VKVDGILAEKESAIDRLNIKDGEMRGFIDSNISLIDPGKHLQRISVT
jgi:hypothetical protein